MGVRLEIASSDMIQHLHGCGGQASTAVNFATRSYQNVLDYNRLSLSDFEDLRTRTFTR